MVAQSPWVSCSSFVIQVFFLNSISQIGPIKIQSSYFFIDTQPVVSFLLLVR